MTNTQYTQTQLLQEQHSAILEDKSKELSRILSDLSDIVKNKISINNFGYNHTKENFYKYIYNIYDKIKFSSDIFDLKYSKLMEDPQKKIDISFLYLWSTFNDIFYLRILVKEHNAFIFKYDKERGNIIEYDGKSKINNYLSENNGKLSPKKKEFLEKFRDNLQNSKSLIDFIWLVLLYEEKKYLDNFNSCRFKRNNMLITHGNVLKPEFVIRDQILYMKDLIEKLLYLN